MPKKLTREEFIRRAREIHGDKYDYSKVDYVNGQTKVLIICPIHGPFMQTPQDHLSGRGCRRCGYMRMSKKQTYSTEDFIGKSRLVHGDEYDYTPTVYHGCDDKVCIICPIHGPFWQRPADHLQGIKCPYCAGKFRQTNEDFIRRAIEVHGDKYDYSKVEYKNNHTKVCIICPIHGEFWQTPYSHLQGHGCPECAGCKKKDTERFIQDARKVHGDSFDYSLTTYKDLKTDVCIICPIHGPFYQNPNNHLRGAGCPICNESHGEREIAKWLDSHDVKYERQYKVIPEQVLFGRNKFLIDFYLPDHNTFIEFNGRQHYERVPLWDTEEEFADQQDRDRRLREYCKMNKINLIEIPYTEFDNIAKILSRKIRKPL